MKFRATLAALGTTLLLGLLAPPVEAGVPRIPITCGMVVTQDAYLYLTKDLDCSTSVGVKVDYDYEQGTIPLVTVDLRGHTLRGSGEGKGVTAFAYPSSAYLRVFNGRITNWEYGVGGDTDTRATNLKLVGNRWGFFCNGFCSADQISFRGSNVGMAVGGEANAVVTRSRFSGNQTGARVGDINRLDIQRSKFVRNDIGVHSFYARVKVSFSAFRRNGTAILVDNEGENGCADLYRVTYKHNDRDLVGPTCA